MAAATGASFNTSLVSNLLLSLEKLAGVLPDASFLVGSRQRSGLCQQHDLAQQVPHIRLR